MVTIEACHSSLRKEWIGQGLDPSKAHESLGSSLVILKKLPALPKPKLI